MTFEQSLIFFISGALLHKCLSYMMGIYHGVKSFQSIEKFIIIYCISIDIILRQALEENSRLSSKSGATDEEVENIKEAHKTMVDIFRNAVLVIMRASKPPGYINGSECKNWKELERYADQLKKKRRT